MLNGDIVNEELVGMVVDKFFEHWRGINYIDTDLHSVVLSCPYITYAECDICIFRIIERINNENGQV